MRMSKDNIVGILQTYALRVRCASSKERIIEILKELRKEFDLRKIEVNENDR